MEKSAASMYTRRHQKCDVFHSFPETTTMLWHSWQDSLQKIMSQKCAKKRYSQGHLSISTKKEKQNLKVEVHLQVAHICSQYT